MPGEDANNSRRNVLQLTGAALTSLLGAGGVSAAKPEHAEESGRPDHAGESGPSDHSNAPDWLKEQGEGVGLAISERDYRSVSATDVEGIPNDARRVPYEVLQMQVQALNEQIEAGEIELDSTPDGLTIRRTGDSDGSREGVDR